MSFIDRIGPNRKDLVDATFETNMLNIDYRDRSVTVRDLLNVIGKSYGTVYVTDDQPDPRATLLQYLRRKLLLPGTKEGCGTGACGSCTVMVSKYINNRIKVNACLFPLCACHGLAITTVEGVGNPSTGLHAVQKRLIEGHGLQCGFCTPGVIMSMFTLLRNKPHPSRDDVETALQGNLCRCTGYRPILYALNTFADEQCPLGEQCCKHKENNPDLHHASDSESTDRAQVPIFPSELQLNNEYYEKSVEFQGDGWTWIRPVVLSELVQLKARYSAAPVVMGNTSAVHRTWRGEFGGLRVLLYGAGVAELKEVNVTHDGIEIGAAVTLTEMAEHIKRLAGNVEENKSRFFKSILNMIASYGSDQIRNVSTLGGSLLSGRFNSDVLTLFNGLNSTVTLVSESGERCVPLCGNMNISCKEIIKLVTIPKSTERCVYQFYKQADRKTFAMAIINSMMMVEIENDDIVKQLRLCFGCNEKLVILTEKDLPPNSERSWNNSLKESLLSLIKNIDIGKYKEEVAVAFLLKFFETVLSKVGRTINNKSILSQIERPPASSIQFYDPCTDPDQAIHDAVGHPVPNVSSEAIVSGEAVFVDDMPRLEGELFLSLVCSLHAHARITSVDTEDALSLRGVHGYIDHKDIQGKNKFGVIEHDEEIFASEKVVCVGQAIGAILADTREVAHKAASLVQVEYEDLKPIITIEDAIEAKSYFGDILAHAAGDVEEGLTSSDHVISGEYNTCLQEHMYIEPQAALVVPKIENNEIDVYCASHGISGIQDAISDIIDVSKNKVHCKVRRLGGSFGGKETRNVLIAAPAAIAVMKYKRPVRCVLPRSVDMKITGKRDPFTAKYKVGFSNDGHIIALDMNVYSNAGCSRDVSVEVTTFGINNFDGGYKLPNVRVEARVCMTNTPSNTSFRSFGGIQGCLIMEDIIYNVACKLDKSQDEIREMNLYKTGDTTPYGLVLQDCTLTELWSLCKEKSEYQQRLADVMDYNRKNCWKKKGLAMTTTKFSIGFQPLFLNQASALVNIYNDGSVFLTHGGIEMGQGINTKMIQIASRALGIPMTKIYTGETGTNTIPNRIATGASMGTDLYGPAVLDACNTLQERLRPVRNKHPAATWEELIIAAFFERVHLSAIGYFCMKDKPALVEGVKLNCNYDYFSYGVSCTEVEIDVLTGENQVLRTDIIFDVGKSLNPAIDIGQIEGGFMQGLGMVTCEDMTIDASGHTSNCNPLSYKIPNVTSIPRQFNVTLLKNHRNVSTIYSSKGIGEPPLLLCSSVLLAIKEAVKAARVEIGSLGYFRLDPPATVERIRMCCGDQTKNA